MNQELFLDQKTIQKKVKELADYISSDYKEQEPLCIGVLNGAVFFFADLVRQLTIPVKIDFIRAASYGSGLASSGTVRFTKDVEMPIQGRSVILVEDIVDTGLTLSKIIAALKAKNPGSLKVCALIDKHERRTSDVHVDYLGFRIDEGFVVGYGLDFNENYRQLPEIYLLK